MCVPIYTVSKKCRLQTGAEHCFHHVLDNVRTIVPLFFNPLKTRVCSLHFVLSTNLYIKDHQDMNIFLFFSFSNYQFWVTGENHMKHTLSAQNLNYLSPAKFTFRMHEMVTVHTCKQHYLSTFPTKIVFSQVKIDKCSRR